MCDAEICPDCEEATLLPDDHKCPNEDCPSHDLARREALADLGR